MFIYLLLVLTLILLIQQVGEGARAFVLVFGGLDMMCYKNNVNVWVFKLCMLVDPVNQVKQLQTKV